MIAVLALVAALLILTLPSRAAVRAGALSTHGRLGGRTESTTVPPVGRRRGASLALVIPVATVLGVALRWGVLLGVASAAVVGTAALLLRDLRRRRSATRLHRELVTVVGVLAGELAAGGQPSTALAAAAEVGVVTTPVFAAAAQMAGRGGDAASVLIGADVAGVRPIGLAWQVVESTGAALTQVMERVAGDLVAQDALRRTVAVALAGPRSSAVLLSLLPIVGIALGVAMGASPIAFLTGEPLGQLLCCVGVLLDVAGVLWIRQIVHRVEAM